MAEQTKQIFKKVGVVFVVLVTTVVMAGVGNLLPTLLPTRVALATVTTKTITGLTSFNQIVAPAQKLAVFGFNLVGSASESLNSVILEIMGPPTNLVALSGTASASGVQIYKDHATLGTNGTYDSNDTLIEFTGTAPSWDLNTYKATFDLVDNVIPADEAGANAGNDYFVVITIKPAAEIYSSSMFGFEIPMGGIAVTGDTNIPATLAEAQHVYLDAGIVVINEIVTDPQQDWSTGSGGVPFSGTPGGTASQGEDEYIELYIKKSGLNLSTYTIELNDASPVTGDMDTVAFEYSRYIASGVGGCSGLITSTCKGDYIIIGNVAGSGSMDNNIKIILKSGAGATVDQVTLGSYDDGSPGDNGPAGTASGTTDEAVGRNASSQDWDYDRDDFVHQTASPAAANNTPPYVRYAELASDDPMNHTVIVEFSELVTTTTAETVTNYQLETQGNANPSSATKWTGEGTRVRLVFSQVITANTDTLAISGVEDADGLSGSYTGVQIYGGGPPENEFGAKILINEIVTNPASDWNDTAGGNSIPFDISPGTGTKDTDDEYIELYINRSNLDLTGTTTGQAWALTIFNTDYSSPITGNLAAYHAVNNPNGLFTFVDYIPTGPSTGTASSTQTGDYLILGSLQPGDLTDSLRIELQDPFGGFVDSVTLNGFNDGYTGDNAHSCASTTLAEAVGRSASSADTENDSSDFGRSSGSPRLANLFNPQIAVESVYITSPTEIGIDFTEKPNIAVTSTPNTYFKVFPTSLGIGGAITIQSAAFQSYGNGRFLALTLSSANALTAQEYTIRVSPGNNLGDAAGQDTNITQTDYKRTAAASDITAPRITGTNVITDIEVEILFDENSGLNIYGADDITGGTDANADAIFSISPGLGTVSASAMWDRVRLQTTNTQTAGATYTVTISNLRDRATPSANILTANSHGGTTDNQTTFTGFSTSTQNNGLAPTVIWAMPAPDSVNIPLNIKKLRLGFSEPMDPESFTTSTPAAATNSVLLGKVNTTNWTLDTGALVNLSSVVYNTTDNSIEITIPAATLLATATPYMLKLMGDNNNTQAGVRDITATEMTYDYQTSFWTAIAKDATKPTILNTSLDDYASQTPAYSNVPVGLAAIKIYFSEAMNPATIIDSDTADASNNISLTYVVSGSATKVAGRVDYFPAGNMAEFYPNKALVQGTTYSLNITTACQDSAGNALQAQYTQTFTTTATADTTGPSINFADSDGYMMWIQFSEPVKAGQATNLSNWTLVVQGASNTSLQTAVATYHSAENGMEIKGLSGLAAGNSFTVTAPSTLEDLAGNVIVTRSYTNTVFNPNTWNDFPMLTQSYPYSWASGVPVAVTISVSFSEGLDGASVTSSTVRLYPITITTGTRGALATGTVSYISSSKTITFDPNYALEEDQDYELIMGVECAPGAVCDMTQSIRDAGGLNIPYAYFINFHTGAGTDTTASSLTSSNPAQGDGVGADPDDVATGLGVISLFFSEALNPASLTNTNIFFATSGDIAIAKTERYIRGTIDYKPMAYLVDFKPANVLVKNTSYTLRIDSGVTDASGNAASTTDITFETVNADDTTAPYVDFSNADPFGVFIKFSEPVNSLGAENIKNYSLITCAPASDLDTAGYNVSLTGKTPEYHFFDNSAYIPNLNLTAGNKYRLTVTNITDLAGNSINTQTDTNSAANHRIIEATNIQFNQYEGNIFDMTYMDKTVYVMSSFPNTWDTPTAISKIKIAFSEALDTTTVNANSVMVIPMVSGAYSEANKLTGLTITWSSATNEVVLTGFTLTANTEYKIKVTTAIKDGGGNNMLRWNPQNLTDNTAYESFFKTASTAGADTTAPQIWGTNLEQYRNVQGQIVNVPLWFTAIDIMFSEQMDEDTIRNVDAAASSTIFISGTTTTLAVATQVGSTTTTLADATGFATSTRIKITEPGKSTVYAEITDKKSGNDVWLNKAVGVAFSTNAVVTKLVKGFIDYDPWGKKASFVADEPLGQNKTYLLNIGTGCKDLSGNEIASDTTYKFTTENVADDTEPLVTWAEAKAFEVCLMFSEPLQRTLAENLRNYTLESPIGKTISLDGKPIEYIPMDRETCIRDLNLAGDNTFKISVSTRILDLSGNAASSTATSTDGRADVAADGSIYNNEYEGYVMAHFEDFFGGKDAMVTAGTFTFDNMMFDNFMNKVEVMPMNPMVGKTTNYFVNFPTTSPIPKGGQIIIKFPEGFDLSDANVMDPFDPADPTTWGMEQSPMNNDINGFSAGIVTIASVATSSVARTLTITTGGATTTQDFITIDLKGIKNPSSPHDSPDYTATITIKDVGGDKGIEGPFNSQPIFIQAKGTNIIQGIITLPGADADEEIIVELHGPAGMQHQTLTINDDKRNDHLGATSTEAAGEADYRFSDLPKGGYDVMVMGSGFTPMIRVNKAGTPTEYFPPAMHQMLWVEANNTATSSITLVDSTAASWTDDWGNAKTMRTLTVIITGSAGLAQKKAKVDVSGPGQFFGKEINFDAAGNASTTFKVPEEMYWVNIHPFMPMMMMTMGPPPPPPFVPPAGKDVFVNNVQDGAETGVDQLTFNLADRTADYYLEVTVQDSVNHVGVNKAEVFAHNPMGFGVPPTKTNSNGTTTLQLPEGVYMVGVAVPGFPPSPEKSVEITSVCTSTNPARVTFNIKMDLTNTFKISGTVKDTAGNVQAAVPVWADERNAADTGFMFGHIPNTTDSNGAFEFRVPSATTWRVQAFVPGYGDTDSVTVREIAADRTGLSLTTKSELALITGTILVNNVAVSSAHVFAEGISGTNDFRGSQTEADGSFKLRVAEGTYKIGVFSKEFGEKVLVASQTVTETQATTSATIALGNQEISTGKNARTVTLEFRDALGASSTPEEIFVDIKDASGNGIFEDFNGVDSGTVKLPEGTYTVKAHKPGIGELTAITDVVVNNTADTNEVGTDRVAITVAGSVNITGKIFDDLAGGTTGSYDAGEQVANAFVTAFSETTGQSFSARTATTGVYTLEVPENDTYKVMADKVDYVAFSPQVVTVTTTDVTGTGYEYPIESKNEDLKISGSVYFDAALSANLADNTNKKARVWAESDDGKWASAEVEADGTYDLYVTAGDWEVRAAGHGGYRTAEANKQDVTVTTAVQTGKNIVLSAISGYSQAESQATPFTSNAEGRAFSADNTLVVVAPPDSIENTENPVDVSIDIKPTTNVPEKKNKITAASDGTASVTNPISPLVEYAYDIIATADGDTKNNLDGEVQVKFSYANYSATDKAAIEANPSIFTCQFLNEAGQWQATDVSFLDIANDLLICPTDHFTTYAPSLPTNQLAPATTTGVSATAGDRQNTVTWTANTEGDMSYYIVWETEATEGQVTTVQHSSCSATCSYIHTGLTNGTAYGYQILAVDTSGFTAAGSWPVAAATPVSTAGGAVVTGGGVSGDTTAPSISALSAIAATTTATVSWLTSESSITWLVYGTSTAYGSEYKGTTYSLLHSVSLTGLVEGTTYHYQVKARDSSANTGSYTDKTFACLGEAPVVAVAEEEVVVEEVQLPEEVELPEIEIEIPTVVFEKPIAEMTVAEIRDKIAEITDLIATLQAELLKLIAAEAAPPTELPLEVQLPAEFVFSVTLKFGMVSTDVKYLQMTLNVDPATVVAAAGVGSAGAETTYFGPLTKAAVIKFQEKYASDVLAPWGLTAGTGLVGSTTRAKLNELLGR